MNNIWTVVLLVVACIAVSFLLSRLWAPYGWIGLLVALGIVAAYIFKRNRRMQ